MLRIRFKWLLNWWLQNSSPKFYAAFSWGSLTTRLILILEPQSVSTGVGHVQCHPWGLFTREIHVFLLRVWHNLLYVKATFSHQKGIAVPTPLGICTVYAVFQQLKQQIINLFRKSLHCTLMWKTKCADTVKPQSVTASCLWEQLAKATTFHCCCVVQTTKLLLSCYTVHENEKYCMMTCSCRWLDRQHRFSTVFHEMLQKFVANTPPI